MASFPTIVPKADIAADNIKQFQQFAAQKMAALPPIPAPPAPTPKPIPAPTLPQSLPAPQPSQTSQGIVPQTPPMAALPDSSVIAAPAAGPVSPPANSTPDEPQMTWRDLLPKAVPQLG